MTDIIDKANNAAVAWLNTKLAKHKTPPANAITECIECGEPIGTVRKQAVPYAIRCIDCQAVLELQMQRSK